MFRAQERSQQGADRAITRRLLRCGAVAGPLFVATFVATGATRADYDPLRHPVSSLALGPGGWVQSLNFTLAGGLYVAGSVGLARARTAGSPSTGPVLIAAAAVGLLGAGAFLTDPVTHRGHLRRRPATALPAPCTTCCPSLPFSDYQQPRWSTRATSDAAASRVGRRIQPEPVQPCSPSPPLPAPLSIRHPLWWPMEACSSGPLSPPASPG